MSSINKISEQTELLLEKQRETLDYCENMFDGFFELINEKIEKAEQEHDAPLLERLNNINSMVEHREEELNNQITEDISFLEEQLDAIEQVKALGDEEKAEELTSLMLEGKESEIPDTDKFKEDIEEEAIEVKSGFSAMIDDMKAALEEGSVEELEAFLQEEEDRAEKEDDDEDEDEESCGSSCSGCGEKEMCGKDLFKGLEEKEDFDDKDDKEKCDCDDKDCDCDDDGGDCNCG
jgi:hypothetical protein